MFPGIVFSPPPLYNLRIKKAGPARIERRKDDELMKISREILSILTDEKKKRLLPR